MAKVNADEQIKRLEAKIKLIKERAEKKKARKNPSVKFMAAALRSIDKALNAAEEPAIRKALDEARGTVSSCLALCGVKQGTSRGTLTLRLRAQGSAVPNTQDLLTFMKGNPGSRSEQISAALGSDAATLRTAMQKLIDAGKVRTEGQRRGRKYFSLV